jgi:ribosomal-protein-alanine N-acetyltransferase
MMQTTLPWLKRQGVSLLGWLPEAFWPEQWLTAMGFRKANWIVTYSLDRIAYDMPGMKPLTIRPATAADVARLAEIERDAFEPLWRHSSHGLLLAFSQAVSFDVAEADGQIVGFQYSVAGQDSRSTHLVRLTVAPEAQGHGIGSSLMLAALEGYERMCAKRVTLNTQADNHASHRLYERFGFRLMSGQTAVWALDVP